MNLLILQNTLKPLQPRHCKAKAKTLLPVLFLFQIISTNYSYANEYWADAIYGSDSSLGTETSPFQTLNHALSVLQHGDTLFLKNGRYGEFIFAKDPVAVIYSDWVTIKAANGHTPHITRLDLGSWGAIEGGDLPFSEKGNTDLRLRIEGLIIDDGLKIYGSRYVHIKNCTITMTGELTSLYRDSGVEIRNGRYITLENNDITHCGGGINAMSYNLTIKNNHIHHNTHDGINILGGDDILIEGNSIHDLDDGADDTPIVPWGAHVDGIHIYMVSNDNPKWANDLRNLTVRGNLFYHIECMGIMINENEKGQYRNFIFEHNTFGPTGGIVGHFGERDFHRLVYRNNTILYAPNDTWVSIFGRKMNGQEYRLSIWGDGATPHTYEFYNNIFANQQAIPQTYGYVDANIHLGTENRKIDRGQIELSYVPYDPINVSIDQYLLSGNHLGATTADSITVDSGSIREAKEIGPYRYYGKAPDIGAFEYHTSDFPWPLYLQNLRKPPLVHPYPRVYADE
jgi:parallel beta-helix repeat protein